MERLGDILGNQNQSRGTNQPELLTTSLPTSHKERRTCSECGNEFEAAVYYWQEGSELPPDELCPICKTAKEEREQIGLYKQYLEEEREEVRKRWLNQCGVTGIFLKKTFDNFKRELQPKAYDAVKSPKSRSLVLLSPKIYGVGKTHLVSALANHLVATTETAYFQKGSYDIETNQCPVHLTTEVEMLARIRNTYDRDPKERGETEEKVFSSFASFPLLIIDDVGKVQPKNLSFLQGVYYRIIDARYINQKRIILTTNLTPTELEEHIGGACADRLREMCGKSGFFVLKGPSYRKY